MDAVRSQVRVVALIVSVFLIGTFGYRFIEGWSFFDAFYMTAITISTVGYGEVRELSTAGRLFSVFLIFGGLGSAALFASTMAQAFVEQNFREAIEARRMQKMIQRLTEHYIVCGFGGIGASICRVLKEAGVPFVIVEDEDSTADFAAEKGYLVVRGKATYDMTLLRAGIERASGIVVCLGDDSVNVYVTLAARELNPDAFIVARGYKADVEKRMVRAGADTVVNPLRIGGEQIANLIATRHQPASNEDSAPPAQASVMGVSLREYQPIGERPVSVRSVLERTSAFEVLKIRHSDGSETHRPDPNATVAPRETALLLFQDGAVSPKQHAAEPSSGWSESLATGIEELDAQLRDAFALIDTVRRSKDGARTARFEELLGHLTRHFEYQAEQFELYGYPHAETHMDDHQAFLEQLVAFKSMAADTWPPNACEFFASWLETHIRESDTEYAGFVGEHLRSTG